MRAFFVVTEVLNIERRDKEEQEVFYKYQNNSKEGACSLEFYFKVSLF